MDHPIQLTEDEFDSKYTMVKNHLDDNASLDGCMFETYDDQVKYIASLADTKTVWTYLEGDDDCYFVTGMHFVNRLGYFITTEPYTQECEVKLNLFERGEFMTHSPSPWVFVQDTRFTYEKYCVNHQNKQLDAGLPTVVAEISEGPHGLADARLIAAAPEMLEALKLIKNEVTEDLSGLDLDMAWGILHTVRGMADEALAKATGVEQ